MPERPQRIQGFFAIFDILGFKAILENNGIDYLEGEIAQLLDNLQSTAAYRMEERLAGVSGIEPIESLVFSDTIFLYQPSPDRPDQNMPFKSLPIIIKSLTLLGYAFQAGLPLRGAISFGDFLVLPKCILGKPIAEAAYAEKHCDWSGGILCESAYSAFERQMRTRRYRDREMPRSQNPNILGQTMRYTGQYAGDNASLPPEIQALWWDPWINNPEFRASEESVDAYFTRSRLESRIREKFYEHGKRPTDANQIEKVNRKIRNTLEFTLYCHEQRLMQT